MSRVLNAFIIHSMEPQHQNSLATPAAGQPYLDLPQPTMTRPGPATASISSSNFDEGSIHPVLRQQNRLDAEAEQRDEQPNVNQYEDGQDDTQENGDGVAAEDGMVRDYDPRQGNIQYSSKIKSIEEYEEILAKERDDQAAKRVEQKEDPASAFPTTPEGQRACIKKLYDAFI